MAGLLDEVRRAKRKASEEAGLLPDEPLISPDVAAEPVAEAPAAPAAATSEPAPVRFSEAFAAARQAGVPTFEWNGNEYTSQTAEEAAKQAAPAPAPAAQIGGGSSNAPQAPLDVNALLSNPKAQDNTALRSPLDDLRVNAAQKSAAADQDMAARQRAGAAKPVAPPSTITNSDFDFDTHSKYKAAGTLERGAARGVNALKQQAAGLHEFIADMTGADGYSNAMADTGRKLDKEEAAIGNRDQYLTRNWEGAVSSIVSQTPGLAISALSGGSIPLVMMGAQVFGDEYSTGKAAGLSTADNITRAGINGVAEIIGEKIGMPSFLKVFKDISAGVPADQLVKTLAAHVAKEVPGEELTTLINFANDKFTSYGLNKDAGLEDYLNQAKDTLVQTVMQAGAMGSVGLVKNYPQARQEQAATVAADVAKNKALSDWNNAFKPQPRPAPGTIVPHLGNVDQSQGDVETDSVLDASIAAAIQAQSPIPEQDIPGMQEPTMDPNATMQEAPGAPIEPTLTEQAPPAQQASDLVQNTPWFTNPEQPAEVNTPAPEQPTPQPLAESQAPVPSEPGDVGVATDVAAEPAQQVAPQVEAPAAYTEPEAAPAPRSEYANSHPAQQELDGIAGKYAARAASIVTAKPDPSQRSAAEQDIVDEAARLADITVVDPSTLPDTPAQGQLGRGEFELLTKLGELTGQNFVLVHAPSMKAEQFVAPGTSRNVYIDTSKPFSISPLATAGHETTHIALHTLRNSTDPEDQAIAETVDQLMRDNLKGEDLAAYNRYSGQGHLPVPGQREEAGADMGGNLHTSPAFYTKVLAAIEQKHGTSGVRKFIASIKNALAKLTELVNGRTFMEHYYDNKGNEVPFVKNAAMVRDALEQALTQYYVNHGAGAGWAKTKANMGLGIKQRAKPAAVKRSEPRAVVEAEANRTYKLDLAREARTQNKISRLSTEEVAAIAGAAEKMGLTPPAMRKLLEQARATKNQFPVTDGWSPLTVTGLSQKKDDDGAPIPGTEKVSWQVQPYGYHIPPGKTRASAKTDEAWQKKVADQFEQLVLDIYNRAEQGDKNAQVIIGHQTWYRNVAEVLRREYGGFGDLLADLLGATSPNTPVDTNWRFSVEILRRFVRGDFDAEMAKFDKYVAEGKPLAKYPRADKITQVSGKLYGMNSINSMKALLDMWRVIETGQAPKARNFALNLIGQSKMATIDVWAARMLRRAANQVRGANLPRIPVPAEAGVDGVWNASKTKVTGAYGFGAEVMQIVSDRLQAQGKNITPPDLQAIAWFAEKELWGSKGWTSVQGEGGSFEERIEGTPVDRFLAGFSIQQGEKKPEPEAVSLAQARVLTMLTGDDSVLAARVLPTKGLYAGTVEDSFDAEWVVTRGQHEPALVMAEIARVADENAQYDFFVSRVIGPNEDNANARPGVELYFKDKHSLQAAMPALDAFTSRGQDGFTLVVDPRAQTKQGEYIGVRLQYVPEISIRWDEGLRAQLVAPGGLEKVLQEKADTLLQLVDTVARMDGVAFAARHNYDTVVVGKEKYDEYINRAAGKGDPRTGGEGWFGQPIRQAVEGAVARLEGERRAVDAGRISAADSLVPADVKQSLPRDGSGRRASGSTATGEVQAPERTAPQEALAGAPRVKGFTGPDPRLVAVAEQYARDNGIDLKRQSEYVQVDEDRARRIAQAYEAMPHAPQDPVVKEAFQNLIRQTTAQYQALVDAGYRFWFTDLNLPNNVEYLSTPWNAMRELRADQVMGVFPTDEGFGTSEFDPASNPLLADTGFTWPVGSIDSSTSRRVLANDLFRAVHDAFGHGLEGAGFRAQGEENAWQAHVRLFTGSALGAITSETRGQNSWLNYGPHGAANQTAPVEDTVFADQKTGLMPEWTWTEGLAGDMKRSRPRQVDTPEFKKWFGDSKVVDKNGLPLVMYHGTSKDVDFTKFKVGARGSWFTSDTEVASDYAIDNDSQGAPYNPDTGRHEKVNTASRVVPVYLQIERPYRLTQEDARRINVTNYAQAQRVLFAEIKAQGYDGILWNDALNKEWVVLGGSSQIKSAIGNNGDFDASKPDIRKSAPRRNDYQLSATEGDPKKGPVFYGDDFVLEALNPVDTTDEYAPNGMVAHGAMGHLGHVTEGSTPYLFRILDTNGKRVGDLMADVKDATIVAIHDFETYSKRSGMGSNIVAHIAASAPGPVRVIDIIKQSQPFWAKFGADYYDPYNNSSLDWAGARQYLAQRQEQGASPSAADADLTAGPGSTGIDVGEVSAEEAAQYRFSLPRPDATSSGLVREGADEAGYGTPIANSVQVKGVHYSTQPRSVLDSSKHGTGMPGAESRRLQDWSATPEQRKRVYFYVDEGKGITPETGVGHVAHSVSLNNLYDLKADPLNLWWKALGKGGSQNDSGNYVEQEVMAAGFDGVYMPAVINGQGVAVLLGDHQVEIKKSAPRQVALIQELDQDSDEFYDEAAALVGSGIVAYAESVGVRAVTQPWTNMGGQATGVEITDLYADKPGSGGGTKTMHAASALADAAGLPLYLRPESERNREFYARFGFQKDPRNYGFLIRYPDLALDEDGDPIRIRKSAPRQVDMFQGDFATKRTTTKREVVVTSKGGTEIVKLGNTDSVGRQIAPTKQALQNFWDWYGAGPVDSKGRPVLLYHSTNADIAAFEQGRESINNYGILGDVTVRRSGIFATPDREFSQEYLRDGSGQNVMQVYMALQNPFDIRDGITAAMENELVDAGINRKWLFDYRGHDWEMFDNTDDNTNVFVDTLKSLGYDGVIIREDDQSGVAHDTYVAFDPASIKSATGNRGRFDATNPDIRKSDPRDSKTAAERRANFAAMIGREDEAQRSYVDDAMAEAEKDWEAAKRGVVPHATTEDAAHALAERLGWSAEATQDALKRGNVAIGGGKSVPAADLLGAAAATSRLAIANLLADPGAADFSQKMAEAINLMIATRANLSEIGRALSYAGWMQRTPGKDAAQRHSDAVEALKQATTAAGNAVGITANMSVDEKQIVSEYNEAMRDLGDARMGLEEANLDTQEATQELRGAWQQVKDARGARDAAKRQLSEANAELRDAEKKRDGAVDRTPSGLTITTAEGLARRAEKEAAKAKEWEQIVKDRIKAAKERLKRAQDQLQRAKDNAADPAELADLEQRADLAAKEAAKATASMQEAQRKLREAENRLKAAQEKEARLKAARPTAHDISQAQGKARRAEQAADKAVSDLREAKRELAKLRAKMRAAEKRAIDAANRLLGIQAQVAQMKEPQFIGKGGVSMAEIEAAVGGKKGMERIQRAMRAQGANLDLGQVAQFFQGIANSIYNQKLEKTKHAGARGRIHNFLSAWLELFRASILTGIFTHGTNIVSNAVFQSVEMLVTRPIAAALPGGAGAGRHYKALAGALMHSVADVVAILRFGMTQEFPAAHFESLAAARPGTRQDLLNLGGNKWMDHAGGALPGLFGKGARTVGFAPLGAMDLLFKVVPYRYSIAMQQASGKPVDYAAAIEMAEYQTFQTKLSEAVSSLPRAVAAFPLAGFIVPFIKTLVNLINRTVDYTPVIGQYRNLDNLMGTHGADARNVALAQGVVGLGLAMVVMALHGDGDDDEESMLSSMGPIDYNKQELWAANNEKLGLRIGDWVVPMWRLEPFASMMGLTIAASDAYRMYQDDGDVAAGGQAVAAALGQVVIGKSFMKGAQEALQALLDLEGRGWTYVTERLPQSVVLGTLIPNFIPQLGDMTDEYKREAQGWSEQVKRRLPKLREELPAKMDYAGRPKLEPRHGTVLPLQRARVKEDPVAQWLLGRDVPLTAMPKGLKADKETGDKLPQELREMVLQKRYADLTKAMYRSGGYEPTKPAADETPEERAGRLKEREILEARSTKAANAAKSDATRLTNRFRRAYGLDSIE